MAATEAKIKFSSEKSKFFTTNVKVLGYSFDTSNVQLTMDKVKASGIMNTKKPSSLYELHSRLASFQYQSMFLPYLKHILYPLNFLPRIILYIKNCRPGMFIRILIFTHPRSRGCMHSTVLSFGAEIQPKTWFSATFDFSLVFRWFSAFSPTLCTVVTKKTKLSCVGGFFSLVYKIPATVWVSWSCLHAETRTKEKYTIS
jgi:hypothetical protein